MELEGTIVLSTVGLSNYGFDVFSTRLSSNLDDVRVLTEHRHTDGISVNFNAQFIDEGETVVFVSERTGSFQLYQTDGPKTQPKPLPTISNSLFHDRPTIKNGRLYFVSAHEPQEPFKSWSAVYSTRLDDPREPLRLTPVGSADLSPAVSKSGELLAVASYGSGEWKGDFQELETEIVVFRADDPSRRDVVSRSGGWPAWSGDSVLFFHRKAEDGWWSVFRSDLEGSGEPRRITPPGVHAFTPAASHDGRRIAVATRRKGKSFRQIEIFDLETEQFYPITERVNPDFHHYNPFFSPESGHLGYHRFRGESGDDDSVIPHLQPITSPVENLRLLRTHMTFPTYSPNGDLIAVTGDLLNSSGLMIIKSDGSKRWTLLKGDSPQPFSTAWSPVERGVVFTSLGPIFQPNSVSVQIARVSFNPDDLDVGEEILPSVKILLTEEGNNAFPSVSPDGKWMVFRSGRSGSKNLYIVDAAEGESAGIRRLTEGDWTDTMPSWSPDGEWIAFSSNRADPTKPEGFGVYLVRPDGTGLKRVRFTDRVDRERVNHLCFSPDSKWLLFPANFGAVCADPVAGPNQFQPYGDLYVARLDGTGLTRLTCNAFESGTPAWRFSQGGNLVTVPVGDKLRGLFEEPRWISTDL